MTTEEQLADLKDRIERLAERLAWSCESLRALDDASRDLAAALSQIPEAKSHDYPLFDIDRALATIERLKSAHHPDSLAVADLDNLAFCLKLAAGGEVDSPPPTATGEGSQSVSEGVNDDAIRLIEAALLKADHELRNGGAHRDAFSILSAAMNQLRTRLIATNPSPPEEGVRLTDALKLLAKPGCDQVFWDNLPDERPTPGGEGE